jgi:hypothetical protein
MLPLAFNLTLKGLSYVVTCVICENTYICAECPPEFRSSKSGQAITNKQGKVTISTLAAMRTTLNETKDRYKMPRFFEFFIMMG